MGERPIFIPDLVLELDLRVGNYFGDHFSDVSETQALATRVVNRMLRFWRKCDAHEDLCDVVGVNHATHAVPIFKGSLLSHSRFDDAMNVVDRADRFVRARNVRWTYPRYSHAMLLTVFTGLPFIENLVN